MSEKMPPSLRNLDEPRLEALVEIMFLAAFADGEFGDEERVHFLKGVESLTDRRVSSATLGRLMETILEGLRTSGRAARLASVKERLTDPGARRAALSVA